LGSENKNKAGGSSLLFYLTKIEIDNREKEKEKEKDK